jgi:8-oxo-dGTP diphosphatase
MLPQRKTYHTNILAVFLVLLQDNDILLSQRKNTGYYDGSYSLVSGHVEARETFTQAMVREAAEEAGIKLDANELKVAYVQHRKSDTDGSERVDAYFVVEKWQGKVTNCEEDKCSELKWFSLESLPDNIVPCVKQAINDVRVGENYGEYGW